MGASFKWAERYPVTIGAAVALLIAAIGLGGNMVSWGERQPTIERFSISDAGKCTSENSDEGYIDLPSKVYFIEDIWACDTGFPFENGYGKFDLVISNPTEEFILVNSLFIVAADNHWCGGGSGQEGSDTGPVPIHSKINISFSDVAWQKLEEDKPWPSWVSNDYKDRVAAGCLVVRYSEIDLADPLIVTAQSVLRVGLSVDKRDYAIYPSQNAGTKPNGENLYLEYDSHPFAIEIGFFAGKHGYISRRITVSMNYG